MVFAFVMFWITTRVNEYNYNCMKAEVQRIVDEVQMVCEADGECPTELNYIEGVDSRVIGEESDGKVKWVKVDIHMDRCMGDSDISYMLFNKTRFHGEFYPSYSVGDYHRFEYGGGVGHEVRIMEWGRE